MAAFNSQTAPDVLELGSDWIAQFSSSGALAAIQADSVDLTHFEPFVLAPGQWQSSLFALPWVIDTRVLFYNKDLLKLSGSDPIPPKTISDLIASCQSLSNIQDIWGFGANGSDPHRLYKKIIYLMWTYGGDVFDVNGLPVLNSNENVHAFEVYAELSRLGLIETQRELDVAFVKGQLAYWISGGWLITKIQNENPQLNYGTALLPGIKPENPGIAFAGGEYLAINGKSKNQSLALDFIKFMSDGENALKLCKAFSEAGFPADKRYFNDDYFKSVPAKALFSEQLKYSRLTPVHPKWLEFEKLIEDALTETIYERKSARQALDDAQVAAMNLINK